MSPDRDMVAITGVLTDSEFSERPRLPTIEKLKEALIKFFDA
jgi:hypothetical protein